MVSAEVLEDILPEEFVDYLRHDPFVSSVTIPAREIDLDEAIANFDFERYGANSDKAVLYALALRQYIGSPTIRDRFSSDAQRDEWRHRYWNDPTHASSFKLLEGRNTLKVNVITEVLAGLEFFRKAHRYDDFDLIDEEDELASITYSSLPLEQKLVYTQRLTRLSRKVLLYAVSPDNYHVTYPI